LNAMKLDLSRPENAHTSCFIEAFNARTRAECPRARWPGSKRGGSTPIVHHNARLSMSLKRIGSVAARCDSLSSWGWERGATENPGTTGERMAPHGLHQLPPTGGEFWCARNSAALLRVSHDSTPSLPAYTDRDDDASAAW